MNIRPYTDALRKQFGGFHRLEQFHFAGERVAQIFLLFRGRDLISGGDSLAGDRYVRVQLWENDRYSTDHMVATRDGPVDPKHGPRFLRGTTHPMHFATPEEMLKAIEIELTRTDHKP